MYGLETIVVVALVIAAFVLRGRIKRLEEQVKSLLGQMAQLQRQAPPGFDPKAAILDEIRATPAEPAPAVSQTGPAVEAAPVAAPSLDADGKPVESDAEKGPWTEPPPNEPPKRFDWERFIGLRLPVWLGAIALSIAGFFFVSYAIESGFFGPEMRVGAAALAALAFLGGAQFVRSRVKTGNVEAISSALAAASIATMYATAYLATKTYGLVPSGAGFIVTIGVSILAIFIALAFGQVVALVGMVGGYVAPIVYGGGEANAAFLAIYIVALTAVTYAVIRWKNWWRLSAVGLVGPAFWGLAWAATPELVNDAYWGSFFVISLPLIVLIASWPGWREDSDIVSLRGVTGLRTPERGSLAAAVLLAAIGFGVMLAASDFALAYWQGLIVYAAAAVGLGFVSPPHRALQLPILIATSVVLVLWQQPADSTTVFLVTGLLALVFAYGSLDQFRRLREPGLWAGVFGFVVTFFYFVALFKVHGWPDALANKHQWAVGALAIATGLIVLLRYYSSRIETELARSQVYAAWGGAVTTLVSLAIVLELDPLYFPAASALALLGLAAVHLRAPVRGLRILAGIYLAIYVLLVLIAFGDSPYAPSYYSYVFVRDIWDHALTALIFPGIAILAAGTLFQRSQPAASRSFIAVMDIVGIIVEVIGLFYLFAWPYSNSRWSETLVLSSRITGPELAFAAVAVYVGRRFDRPAAYIGGIILTGLVGLVMIGTVLGPLSIFWPPFSVPGTVIINITLLAYGVPALLLYFIGWHLRHDPRKGIHYYGIVVSLFAVATTYAMVLVDIRQAWHLGSPTLAGDTSQSEFYAYSIATLIFGLILLIGGVAFKHRGARAVSFVFVLAATVKVFLFDASELTGLWRVLSFLLMGLSFLGISWAYARFVFGIGLKKPTDQQSGLPPP